VDHVREGPVGLDDLSGRSRLLSGVERQWPPAARALAALVASHDPVLVAAADTVTDLELE
jgi:hypothetical protein